MTTETHIIYLSGFGDKYNNFRQRMLNYWHYKNVTVEFVPMNWEHGTFAQKVDDVDRAIDKAEGKRIVLIGESAGGSMVVHMYARRPNDIYKAMTLCGKNSHPETVGSYYFERSPAFQESMDRINVSIEKLTAEQRADFVSIYPLADPTVPVRETLLSGCKRVRLWTFGHFGTIVLGLTLLSPIVVRAAKK